MLGGAVLPLLAALLPLGGAIWPAPYAVRDSYHLHFATFDDAGADDLEMVREDAACGLNDAETELRMRELDAHAQLDAAPDELDLDLDGAWYPTDYDQPGDSHRKRGLDASSRRFGRLVVDGKAPPADAKPDADINADAGIDADGKSDIDAETNADDEIDADAKIDVDVKPETEIDADAEFDAVGKSDVDAETDAEVKPDADAEIDADVKSDVAAVKDIDAYDYAALRRDYDAEADAAATPSADAGATTPPKFGAEGRGHHESGRGGWAWPRVRVGHVFLAVLGVYIVLAVPCYCAYGWCCCCFFWVPLCRPRDIIREAKRYAAQNPPGVMRAQPARDAAAGNAKDTDKEGHDDGDSENAGDDKDAGRAAEAEGVNDADADKDVEGDGGRRARRRAMRAADDGVVRYRASRGEREAYNALMAALRGL